MLYFKSTISQFKLIDILIIKLLFQLDKQILQRLVWKFNAQIIPFLLPSSNETDIRLVATNDSDKSFCLVHQYCNALVWVVLNWGCYLCASYWLVETSNHWYLYKYLIWIFHKLYCIISSESSIVLKEDCWPYWIVTVLL